MKVWLASVLQYGVMCCCSQSGDDLSRNGISEPKLLQLVCYSEMDWEAASDEERNMAMDYIVQVRDNNCC
jgi:hypothetical protein